MGKRRHKETIVIPKYEIIKMSLNVWVENDRKEDLAVLLFLEGGNSGCRDTKTQDV